jgi:hypothetical protein
MEATEPTLRSIPWMDEDRWQRGLTIEAFVQGMTTFQAEMRRRVEHLRLTPFERNQFAALRQPVRMLAVTEDWCSDSLMNLPILAQATRSTKLLELRVFPRSEWPELCAALEARGIEAIPAVVFLDADFREIGIWIERPQSAHRKLAAWIADHPQWGEITGRTDLGRDEKRALLQPLRRELLEATYDWYDLGLQCDTVSEVRAILTGYLAR